MLHLLEFIILELISVQEYWFITTNACEYFAFQNYEADISVAKYTINVQQILETKIILQKPFKLLKSSLQ